MADDQDSENLEPNSRNEAAEAANGERKHLESLLKDRINFHLLFASVFMAGVSAIRNHWLKVWALITITFISLLIGLAVLRTHLLVMKALKQIKEDNAHPYTRFSKSIRCFPVNANSILLAVPFTLTAFFLGTTIYYCVFPSADSVDTSTTLSPPSTVYRIEDNSEHRIMIAAPGKSPSVSSPAPLSHRKRKAR